MVRILITNDGPHSSEQWAVTSAEMIFDISQLTSNDRLLPAKKLQLAIAESLITVYDKAQKEERNRLSNNPDHIITARDDSLYIDQAMQKVRSTVKGSEWQSHFDDQHVIQAAKAVMHNHLDSLLHVERLWFADNNLGDTQAQLYKSQHTL